MNSSTQWGVSKTARFLLLVNFGWLPLAGLVIPLPASAEHDSARPEAKGPRIINFKTTMRVINGGRGLVITCTLKPDESRPPGHALTKEEVRVTFNDRTIRRSLYSFDAKTGDFSLSLDARAMKTLEATRPFGFEEMGAQNARFNRLEFRVNSKDGHAQVTRNIRPLADLLTQFMGTEAPTTVPPEPCVAGRHGAPGRDAKAINLRHERDVLPSGTEGRAQAYLVRTDGDGMASWTVQGAVGRLLPVADTLRREDQEFFGTIAAVRGLQQVQLVPFPAYAASMDGPSGRTDGVLVRGQRPDRRIELPRFFDQVGGMYANDAQAILQRGSGALEAFTWDGKSAWRQDAWPRVERGDVQVSAGELKGIDGGGVLEVSAGRGTIDGVAIPFLAVRRLAADGSVAASSFVLDPSPGAFDFVEDVRVAQFHGRTFGVVTSSHSTGYDLLTRVYDMASPGGVPVLQLATVKAESPMWTWGALTVGDRLAIGRGDGGVALLAPAEKQP
ncbi:MAG: hypothetical protein JWM80_5309 [Cyanobacteria bacterium RYN_339]|nr:hypothetical protein [Cyanobacteria bacterium RYN_339]